MSSEDFTAKRQPGNWCGTKTSTNANEADQVPVNDNMSTFQEGPRSYPCITQDGITPTFGEPPQSSGGSMEEGSSGLMVGINEIIPRWAASTASPTKLLYFVVKDGFSDADFKYVLLPSRTLPDILRNTAIVS